MVNQMATDQKKKLMPSLDVADQLITKDDIRGHEEALKTRHRPSIGGGQ